MKKMKFILRDVGKVFIFLIFLFAIINVVLISYGKVEEITSISSEILQSSKKIGENSSITSMYILQKITGEAPFDDNNNPGNDISSDNDIVRSFDQISWTIEATMGLNASADSNEYKGGILEVKAELPEANSKLVKWDIDSMKWAIDAKISDDGRIFTANYILTNDNITIPGKQTLVFVAKVLNAQNGLEIKPKFSFSLYGNDEIKEVEDSVTRVTATPKYNVQLIRNGNIAYRDKFNFSGNNIDGRVYGYGIVVQLYNDDINKGLKGIEIPSNDITFDINLKLERNDFYTTDYVNITSLCEPLLWNYKLNQNTSTGIIENRTMNFGSFYHGFINNIPYGVRTSDRDRSTYQSGNIEMISKGVQTVNGEDNAVISTTISDYDFDGIFPTRSGYTNISNDAPIYSSNVGVFNVGYFQIIVPDNEESTKNNTNYYLTVEVNNFKAQSISGVNTTTQVNTSDDKLRISHSVYIPGHFNHHLFLGKLKEDDNGDGWLGSAPDLGDATAVVGQSFKVNSHNQISVGSDDIVKSVTKFIKFDGNAYKPELWKSDQYTYDENRYRRTGPALYAGNMEFKVWYITKSDGTNWLSQDEMNNADLEDIEQGKFKFYRNIEDIPSGHICVAEYIESTTGELNSITGTDNSIAIKLKVKDTASIGQTYGLTQTTRFWLNYIDRNTYTIENKNFSSWPEAIWNSKITKRDNYVKTEYDDNGVMQVGTHYGGWEWGQSVLVLGANLRVSKLSINETTNQEKTNYELVKNETTVTYQLNPVLTSNSLLANQITGVNIKIEDTIPKGITYISESSNKGEPIQTLNNDGSVTLTWYIDNCTVGTNIEPITYKAKIDETSENGMQYTSNVVISEYIKNGEITKIGNSPVKNRTAVNTITIIDLASYSLYKNVETPVIEVNGTGIYKLVAVNKTDVDINNFKLLDILPFNEDGRGTNFHGRYEIEKIELKQINYLNDNEILNNNLNLYTSSDLNIRYNVSVKDNNLETNNAWTLSNSNMPINKVLTGYFIKGNLKAKSKLEVYIYLKTSGNIPGDVYQNNATAETNTETEEIKSSTVKIEVVKRSIEGNVWLDKNVNGLMETNEPKLNGIIVTLLKSDGTPANDVNGNEMPSITTNNNGYYKFDNLEKGIYKIQINYPNEYELTEPFIGDNIKLNSKFTSVGETELLTKLNTLTDAKLEEKYINAGLVFKKTNVIINYIDKTSGDLIEKVSDNGRINDEYTGKSKNFDEYVLIEKPESETIVLKETGNELNYYYVKVSGGVIEKHVDINTQEILANEVHEGKVGDDYHILNKEFEGYDLVEDKLPINNKGKMEENPIEVVYYYQRKTKVIVKYIDKDTGEKITKDVIIDGHENELYETEQKEFKNYQLAKLPENKTGNMKDKEIEVIYYYEKIYLSSSPQTGDTSNIILWIILIITSIIGILASIIYIKKIENKNN